MNYTVLPFGEKDLLVTLFVGFFSPLNRALLIKGLDGRAEAFINVLIDGMIGFLGKLSYTTFIA